MSGSTKYPEQLIFNASTDDALSGNTQGPIRLTMGMMYWNGSAWTRFSSTTLDTIYLRLDTTNNPLTGNLTISKATPTITLSDTGGSVSGTMRYQVDPLLASEAFIFNAQGVDSAYIWKNSITSGPYPTPASSEIVSQMDTGNFRCVYDDGIGTTYADSLTGNTLGSWTFSSNYVGVGTLTLSSGGITPTTGTQPPSAFTIIGKASSGTNVAGGDLELKSGSSTGTATANVTVYTAPAGGSGSGVNTPTLTATFSPTQLTMKSSYKLNMASGQITTDTTTGLTISGATNQKLGFFGATPVVQITGSTDVLAGLVTLGLRAASSNPALNLGSGQITCGKINASSTITSTLTSNHIVLSTFSVNTVTITTPSVASPTTITLPNATSTLATLGLTESFTGAKSFTTNNVTITDVNVVLGTTTGTKFGTATSQKLAFYNSTAITQPGATTDLGTVLSNLGLRAAGTAYPITTSGAVNFTGGLTIATVGLTITDVDVALSATTGTKFGTATTQKLAFYNSTPLAQASSTGETVGFTAGAGTNVTDQSTFTGNVGSTAYRLSDIVKHLKNLGLIAA